LTILLLLAVLVVVYQKFLGVQGGGGAGGLRSTVTTRLAVAVRLETALSVRLVFNYTVTVGAGGEQAFSIQALSVQ
jgi:hypothetical protein